MFLGNCSIELIEAAAKKLAAGNLVAFPTETVYGLGADATNQSAVEKIYRAKGRPSDHPLIVHIGDQNQMAQWAEEINPFAIKLARDFWPGPMTLILQRSALAKDFITGGQDSIGLRVPAHPVALALLKKFSDLGGKGVAAPSANRFGGVSPTTAMAVANELLPFLDINNDQILDGGDSLVGVESTIIDCRFAAPVILRPGAITKEMIMESTGLEVLEKANDNIRVSGSLESHYSPKAKVILNAIAEAGEGFIAYSNIPTPNGAIRLASPKTVEEYARALYAALREADARELQKVVVVEPEGEGLAEAIRDRLKRASA
jgi:L-threonylcarbamoyladenylate synthase